jgi:YfiH family protein
MTAQFVADPLLHGLPHGFFTRLGGVSTGAFAALNCSLSGRDDPDAVRENRARAADALGLPPAALVGLHQVHGPDVLTVTAPWHNDARPKADAMVTDRPGVALAIVTADCAPVLFADSEAGVVGAAHAGWRSALSGVVANTVAAMRALGARRITAAIGPSIRQPSYEVSDAFRQEWLAADPAHALWFTPGDRPGHQKFDLAGAVAAAARVAGCTVSVVPADTLADEDRFFSYRRATLHGTGPIGHQVSIIALPA